MHRASGPAYTFIIVGFGLFRKCFHDNFFTKRGGKSSAKSGRAAAGKHPPQPCTGRAGAGKGKGKAPRHLLAQRQRAKRPLRRQGQVLNFLKVWRAGKVIFGRNKGIHRAACRIFHGLAVLVYITVLGKLVSTNHEKALRHFG